MNNNDNYIPICSVFSSINPNWRFKYRKYARTKYISKRIWGPYAFYSYKQLPMLISYMKKEDLVI